MTLKEYREKKGWSIEDLSINAGVPVTKIKAIESRTFKGDMFRYMRALGINKEDMSNFLFTLEVFDPKK